MVMHTGTKNTYASGCGGCSQDEERFCQMDTIFVQWVAHMTVCSYVSCLFINDL